MEIEQDLRGYIHANDYMYRYPSTFVKQDHDMEPTVYSDVLLLTSIFCAYKSAVPPDPIPEYELIQINTSRIGWLVQA